MSTPLEEFLEAAFGPGARLLAVEITPEVLTDRAALVKALWNKAVLDAPPGALDGKDGLILQLDDPTAADAATAHSGKGKSFRYRAGFRRHQIRKIRASPVEKLPRHLA